MDAVRSQLSLPLTASGRDVVKPAAGDEPGNKGISHCTQDCFTVCLRQKKISVILYHAQINHPQIKGLLMMTSKLSGVLNKEILYQLLSSIILRLWIGIALVTTWKVLWWKKTQMCPKTFAQQNLSIVCPASSRWTLYSYGALAKCTVKEWRRILHPWHTGPWNQRASPQSQGPHVSGMSKNRMYSTTDCTQFLKGM